MSEIIALGGLIASLFFGFFRVNFWELWAEWEKSPTRITLYKSYVFCTIPVLILNTFVLLARCVIREGGGVFFPTYIQRTPLEWFLGAVLSSVIIFLLLCFLVRDYYLGREGKIKPGFREGLIRWRWFYYIDISVGLISYAYQVYWYGWWPW